MHNLGAAMAGGGGKRRENDFYPTPPEATVALLREVKLPHVIWEPACGDGAMAEVQKKHGHAVIATDVTDRGYGGIRGSLDFLTCDENSVAAQAIVTNPPFALAEEFICKALSFTPHSLHASEGHISECGEAHCAFRGASTVPRLAPWVEARFHRRRKPDHGLHMVLLGRRGRSLQSAVQARQSFAGAPSMKSRFTPQQQNILDLIELHPGVTAFDIALAIGTTTSTVRVQIHKLSKVLPEGVTLANGYVLERR